MRATIKLWDTKNGKVWYTTKNFNNNRHLDNYTAMMYRNHGHLVDEVWINE